MEKCYHCQHTDNRYENVTDEFGKTREVLAKCCHKMICVHCYKTVGDIPDHDCAHYTEKPTVSYDPGDTGRSTQWRGR